MYRPSRCCPTNARMNITGITSRAAPRTGASNRCLATAARPPITSLIVCRSFIRDNDKRLTDRTRRRPWDAPCCQPAVLSDTWSSCILSAGSGLARDHAEFGEPAVAWLFGSPLWGVLPAGRLHVPPARALPDRRSGMWRLERSSLLRGSRPRRMLHADPERFGPDRYVPFV